MGHAAEIQPAKGGANVIHLFRCVFIVWSLSESQPITDHLLQAHVAPTKHEHKLAFSKVFYLTSRGIVSNHTHVLEQSGCHLSMLLGSRD